MEQRKGPKPRFTVKTQRKFNNAGKMNKILAKPIEIRLESNL